MTIKELRDLLKKHPDNYEVYVHIKVAGQEVVTGVKDTFDFDGDSVMIVLSD